MKFRNSIKFRMNLWYLMMLVIVVLFFSIVTFILLAQQPNRTNYETVKLSEFNVEVGSENINGNLMDSPQSNFSYRPLVAYNIDQNQLQKIHSDPTSLIEVAKPEGLFSFDQKVYITDDMKSIQDVWLYYRPVKDEPGFYDILAVTQSKVPVASALATYKQVLYIAIPVTLVFAGLLGYFLIKRLLKPVEVITGALQNLHEKDLDRKIDLNNKDDEMGKLSVTLNQALERLKGAFDREHQFTSDVSHELRTPLAVMQSEATLALTRARNSEEYQKSLESISGEISHMSLVVSRLLYLARADSGKEPLVSGDVSLKEVLTDAILVTQSLREEKKLDLQTDLQEDLVIKGDEVKLRQLFLNILDNAIKYTPPGGKITLALSKVDGNAQIEIEDTGIGIAQEHLPHIFERFYRANKTQISNDDGSGLGLAISRQISEAHKGQITVQSTRGIGSRFTVTLPL